MRLYRGRCENATATLEVRGRCHFTKEIEGKVVVNGVQYTVINTQCGPEEVPTMYCSCTRLCETAHVPMIILFAFSFSGSVESSPKMLPWSPLMWRGTFPEVSEVIVNFMKRRANAETYHWDLNPVLQSRPDYELSANITGWMMWHM